MIPDEPVRGRIPPPWYHALPGLERVRVMTRSQIPMVPLARLLGIRATHVTAGGCTATMPGTEASLAGNGQLEIAPPMMAGLMESAVTAVSAGYDIVPLVFTIDPLRPAWVRPGNLLSRARVVNSSNLFILSEVHVEDPDGRHLARGSLQARIQRIEPPPPPPPDVLPVVEAPVYPSPDPYLRSYATSPILDLLQQEDGMTVMRGFQSRALAMPCAELFGVAPESVEPGRVVCTMPASEWFCVTHPHVSAHMLAALADLAGWSAGFTVHRRGRTVAPLQSVTRFFATAPADGRPLRAESTVVERAPDMFTGSVSIRDADGRELVGHDWAFMRLHASERVGRRRAETRRVLATLLFTDIVDSTGHAERLGDARWSALLDEHRLAIRRELSRFNGIEIDTAGDGFFVRFDSPAQAVGAAQAAVRAAARLGVAIRAGVHTGECEMEGTKPAGMAVHVASRIQGAAGAGEILVSSTVKDLATGSSLSFADRGEHALKGVPDAWRLYAVEDGS